jgi:pyridoxamine 5'-phosphate oxidase
MSSSSKAEQISLASLHYEHPNLALNEADVSADPFEQFELWLGEALAQGGSEANAMTVATATPDGIPSARTVLLKGFDERGFVFYTNYESQKGRELAANPHVALLFHWHLIQRQIRINGTVERTSSEESAEYFHSRARGSQIGSSASRQSSVIPNREWLEARLRELEAEYSEGEVPLPSYWGGFRVTPLSFEFWQGRPSRLHDRLRYTRQPDTSWKIERLSP